MWSVDTTEVLVTCHTTVSWHSSTCLTCIWSENSSFPGRDRCLQSTWQLSVSTIKLQLPSQVLNDHNNDNTAVTIYDYNSIPLWQQSKLLLIFSDKCLVEITTFPWRIAQSWIAQSCSMELGQWSSPSLSSNLSQWWHSADMDSLVARSADYHNWSGVTLLLTQVQRCWPSDDTALRRTA